tara:strand:+ start:1002 stop:1208 length:207 start_codon:yes stop_codon:yes gene_type:complete
MGEYEYDKYIYQNKIQLLQKEIDKLNDCLDHLVFLIKELDVSKLSQEEYTKTVDEILLFLMLKEDKNE